MNKATIYSENGDVLREMECKSFQPYCGRLRQIVMADGKSIFTNLPVEVSGTDWYPSLREPDEHEKSSTFDVTMLAVDGKTIKTWKKACYLVNMSSLVWFWHEGKMVSACGSLVVENFSADEDKNQ